MYRQTDRQRRSQQQLQNRDGDHLIYGLAEKLNGEIVYVRRDKLTQCFATMDLLGQLIKRGRKGTNPPTRKERKKERKKERRKEKILVSVCLCFSPFFFFRFLCMSVCLSSACMHAFSPLHVCVCAHLMSEPTQFVLFLILFSKLCLAQFFFHACSFCLSVSLKQVAR